MINRGTCILLVAQECSKSAANITRVAMLDQKKINDHISSISTMILKEKEKHEASTHANPWAKIGHSRKELLTPLHLTCDLYFNKRKPKPSTLVLLGIKLLHPLITVRIAPLDGENMVACVRVNISMRDFSNSTLHLAKGHLDAITDFDVSFHHSMHHAVHGGSVMMMAIGVVGIVGNELIPVVPCTALRSPSSWNHTLIALGQPGRMGASTMVAMRTVAVARVAVAGTVRVARVVIVVVARTAVP